MIDVKNFLERHFSRSSKINFHEEKTCIQPLPCTAKLDKYYRIDLVLTKEMPQK